MRKIHRRPKFNRERFKTLVHYICYHVKDPTRLGKTKLHKILYYVDNWAYLKLGRPVTGETYVKRQYGPVAAHLDEVLRELEQEGKVIVYEAEIPYGGQPYQQFQFIAKNQPDISGFKPEEIDLVRDFIDLVCYEHTARSISELSHNLVWKSAKMGEELPYYTAYGMLVGEITPEDIAWAKAQFS